MGSLTPKQARFVEEYLKDLNATQAAIRTGYSVSSAEVQGCTLLSNPKVAATVKAVVDARSQRTQITADIVLFELLRLAKVDIGQAFDEVGNLKPIQDIPEDVRRSIASIEVVEEFEGKGADKEQIGWTKKIRFWDKTKALELLGRYLRLWAGDAPVINQQININLKDLSSEDFEIVKAAHARIATKGS